MRDVSFTVYEPCLSQEGCRSLWPFSPYLRHHLEKKLMLGVILHPCICLKIIGQAPSPQKEAMKE